MQEAVQSGLSGSAEKLPHLERIQQSFGRHALTEVRAFVGGPARQANERLGSAAYATGDSAAFKRPPDLHTAAHEAAHIVQQRAGVQLSGGAGQRGDRHERQADAVADAVVGGRWAEPLLGPHTGSLPVRSNQVQFLEGEEETSGGEDVCEALRAALADSIRVIELYQEFLRGDTDWEAVQAQIRTVGNAAQGVVGAGRDLPQIVQDAISEVESFGPEEISHMGRLIVGLPSLIGGSGEFFKEQWVRNEIERQNHFNLVLIRFMYENSCPDFPGTWTGFQEQILPIGTRGLEQRSTIETTPRETRTAIASVEIGEEHVLVLATEVAGSRRLRFERWIDNEFKELALREARAKQGTIPTVPASAMTGLPTDVPSSAARM